VKDPYDITINTWNKIAKLYEEKFMDLAIYNDSYDAFINLLAKPDASVLEIGCGPGNISRYLLKKRPQLKILGTDVSENMLALARKNNPNAGFIKLDAREISSVTQKYDAIVCGFCIPYLSIVDLENLIKNCTELLNKDAAIYLSCIDGDYSHSGFESGSSGDKSYVYYYDEEYIRNLCKSNNLEVVECLKKNFEKKSGSSETHTIFILKN
jgi:cyclopropane fatty-acyl-phospholipid synthase-like methyltransferase